MLEQADWVALIDSLFMTSGSVELLREVGGLCIVIGWMMCLLVRR
ncbi:MAG: hypothetical protein ACRBBW_01705 [Cellvibrionaceae bacterium]